LDGIHAAFTNGIMTLYFLESKLTKTASAGVADYAKSASAFANNRRQYLLEYDLLSDVGNLTALSTEEQAIALDYFDVYGAAKSQRIERSVGVICYSEIAHYKKKLPKHKSTAPATHEEAFSKRYKAKYARQRQRLIKHLQTQNVDPAECEVFFIAVPDVESLRSQFAEFLK
jgi:uncharacterized protein DUF1837